MHIPLGIPGVVVDVVVTGKKSEMVLEILLMFVLYTIEENASSVVNGFPLF
jgi:hypothetical protein